MYPSAERPGYGAFVWQQAQQLRTFGHTVDVVNILGFRSKLNYLKGAAEVVRITRGAAYDVVHAHYGLSGFPAWFRVQSPLVLTLHGSDVLGGGVDSLCSRLIWRFADRVIVVSEEMQKRIPGTVIPCGVDLNIFKPYDRMEARTRVGWTDDKHIVLFPFDPTREVKRYHLAKAAVDRLIQEGMNVRLESVYNSDNREMPWYYSAADAMILSSSREGSPTSIKEALACNLPVVSTDVGDVRGILKNIPGTQICTDDISDIANKLRSVVETSRAAGFDGRKAMLKYDQPRLVEEIVNVYKQVVRQRTRTAKEDSCVA